MSVIKIELLNFFLIIIFLYSSFGYAGDTQNNDDSFQISSLQEINKNPRIYLPDDEIIGFSRAYRFSHDNQFFALLQLYENDLATIRVWDVKNKELKYKTVITDFSDAAGGSYIFLEFSPNDQLIFISGIVADPLITWNFKEADKVDLSCQSYMGGSVQEISNDDQYYTVKTSDNEFSLCQPGVKGELVNYKDWMPEEWWGNNIQTLHGGKILTIYNYHLGFEKFNTSPKKPPDEVLKWIDLWDMKFNSTANRLISHLDQKNHNFFLIESFKDKVVINQWDYSNRRLVSKNEINGVQVEKLYVSDNYLLLRKDKQFSLIERTNSGLKFLWGKNLSNVYDGSNKVFPPGSEHQRNGEDFEPYSIKFSLDKKYIIFYNSEYRLRDDSKLFSPVALVDIGTGAIHNYPSIELNSSVTVDSKGRYFFKNYYGCKKEKTRLYSLTNYSDIREIGGEVMGMSPDGDILAICHENELSFLVKNKH